MNYRLIPFADFPLLKAFVHDIYEITTGDEGCSYTTVPNGIIGISIKLSGESDIYKNGIWSTSPDAGIYGMIQKPELIRIGPHFREIAIGFKPYFLKLLVSEAMAELTQGEQVDAADVFRDGLSALLDALNHASNNRAICTAINRFIAQQLQPEQLNQQAMQAAELITNQQVERVDELANTLGLSTVTLRNLFREHIGLSPKNLIRLTRIKAALNTGLQSNESLTAYAYRLGYFDQAHFVHDFKNTLGLSPKGYFSNENFLFDFYNFGRWKGDSFGLSTTKSRI